MRMKEIISEVTLEQQGSFKRVRRWLDGHHPKEGVLTFGWQGEPQTVQDVEVITPVVRVTVYDNKSNSR